MNLNLVSIAFMHWKVVVYLMVYIHWRIVYHVIVYKENLGAEANVKFSLDKRCLSSLISKKNINIKTIGCK